MSATVGHEKIGAVQAEAERWSAEEVLRWGLAEFHPRAPSRRASARKTFALIDIAVRPPGHSCKFTLDTDFLFAEPMIDRPDRGKVRNPRRNVLKSLLDAGKSRPSMHDQNCWTIDQINAASCARSSRSRAKLGELTAWATGIRRDQAVTRSEREENRMDEKFAWSK